MVRSEEHNAGTMVKEWKNKRGGREEGPREDGWVRDYIKRTHVYICSNSPTCNVIRIDIMAYDTWTINNATASAAGLTVQHAISGEAYYSRIVWRQFLGNAGVGSQRILNRLQ